MNKQIMKFLISNITSQRLFWLVLGGVLILASFLRMTNLHAFPPILNRDEAALAYNAKLILESGRDEWQQRLPLQFKSFGDYKLPGYIYTLVPFFQVYGQSDWVVRLPSALAGIGIVGVGGVLVNELLKARFHVPKPGKNVPTSPFIIVLLSMFILTLSPVFFFYSRMAWEANLALFLFLGSLLCAVLSVTRDSIQFNRFAQLSAVVLMLLAMFTYNTPLLLLPFVLPLPFILSSLKKWKLAAPLLVGWLVVLVMGGASLLSVAQQKSSITLFSDETVEIEYPAFRQQFPGPFKTLIGNKYVYWGSLMAKNYAATFSPQFLVTSGGSHPWHSILGRGHLYWTIYGAFGLGLGWMLLEVARQVLPKRKGNLQTPHFFQQLQQFTFWKKKPDKSFPLRAELSVLYLLAISPLPAVITTDAPHATRSLFTFFMIVVVAIYGVLRVLTVLEQRKKWTGVTLITIWLVIFSLESSQYLNQFFYQWRDHFPPEFATGFPRALQQAQREFPNEPWVVIDGSGYLYIVGAWYLKLSPEDFFATIARHQPDQVGLQYGYQVENLHFVNFPEDRRERESVVIDGRTGEWKVIKY